MSRPKAPWIAAWAFTFAVLSAIPGYAQAGPGGAFDFGASVESLAEAAETGAGLPVGRYVLLTGTVRSAASQEEGPFSARVEVAAGQWIGTSRVVLRTVLVEVAGDAYRDLFDRGSPSFLRPGSTVLVVARVTGSREAPEGGRVAVLEGVHLRRLDTL
jgi:hypothetical protein